MAINRLLEVLKQKFWEWVGNYQVLKCSIVSMEDFIAFHVDTLWNFVLWSMWCFIILVIFVQVIIGKMELMLVSNGTSKKIMFMIVIVVSWKTEGSEYSQKIRYYCLRHVTWKISLGWSKLDRLKYITDWIVFKLSFQFLTRFVVLKLNISQLLHKLKNKKMVCHLFLFSAEAQIWKYWYSKLLSQPISPWYLSWRGFAYLKGYLRWLAWLIWTWFLLTNFSIIW